MSTPDPFEQHRAAFGAELRRVTPAVKRRQRRLRLAALGGTSIALAGAATAVAVVIPTTGSKLDVVSSAQAAIADEPDQILHFALRYDSGQPESAEDAKRNEGCRPEPGEVWTTTDDGPPRFRLRTPLNPCSVSPLGERIATGAVELAYADDTMRTYSENDGFMTVVTDLPPEAGEQTQVLPINDAQLTEAGSRDPVARIRTLLAEGRLVDAGEVRDDDGRLLRRLTGSYLAERGDPKDPRPSRVEVDYRVDAETFAPVLVKVTQPTQVREDENAPWGETPLVERDITQTTRFTIYETTPLTPETEAQLTVRPKPGTDVTTRRWSKDTQSPEPSAAEEARAAKVAEAQIRAGTRIRAKW